MTLFSRRHGGSRRLPNDALGRPSFDLPTLLDIFEGDRRAIVGLLETAIGSIRSDVAAVENAAAGCDRAEVVALAHRLRGTSGSIGAAWLIDVSSRLERALAEPDASGVSALLAELRAAADAVAADIAAYGDGAD